MTEGTSRRKGRSSKATMRLVHRNPHAVSSSDGDMLASPRQRLPLPTSLPDRLQMLAWLAPDVFEAIQCVVRIELAKVWCSSPNGGSAGE
jgi:hypothetical protein